MLEYFTLFYFSIISLFLIIKDVKYLILPDKYLILLFTGLVIFDLVFKREIIFYHLVSAIFAGLFFLIVHFLTKQSLGLGDVKYSAVIGYFLGINFWIIAIFFACLCGIIMYLLGKKFYNWDNSTKIPFGPFMSISSIVVKIGSIIL